MDNKQEIKEKAFEFLRKQRVAALATVSASGEPHAATITIIADSDFNIYFITKQSSRKFADISANPRVGLTVGFDSDHPQTIQIQGAAEIMTAERVRIMIEVEERLAEREFYWWPLMRMKGSDFAVIKITPEWARWLSLDGELHPDTYKEDFYQLIP